LRIAWKRFAAALIEPRKLCSALALTQALVKFNEAIAGNKALREQIDNLRCERVIFDGIYKKTERDLYDRKKEMARIIEDSNAAYDDRNAAIEELRQLQEQQRESREAFKKEACA